MLQSVCKMKVFGSYFKVEITVRVKKFARKKNAMFLVGLSLTGSFFVSIFGDKS